MRVRYVIAFLFFFFSSRRRHTRCYRDWSSDVCSSDLVKRDYSLLPAVQQGAITHEEVTTVQIYESIFIINPNLTDEETAGVIKKMQDVVAKQGGEMIKFEDWGN